MGKVEATTDPTFQSDVLEAPGLTLVDFWAPWCGPCKVIAPIVEELATTYQGKVKFMKLDVDDGPNTATAYGVSGIPTLMLFKGGKACAQLVGAVPKAQMIAFLEAHL